MSHYLALMEPEPTDVCNQCRAEIEKEALIARRNAAKPPAYDIDQILFATERMPSDIVRDLNRRIDPYCPESLLLHPELVVRDFEGFHCLEGHDFGYILGRNSGPSIFLRALRAVRAIGATHLADAMAKIRDYAQSRGVPFPDPIPDPWFYEITIDSDLENELSDLSDELKPYDGLKGGDTSRMLVEYLVGQAGVLRQRKTEFDGL